MRIKIKTIETKQVIMRKIQNSDLHNFNAYAKKEEVGTNAGWAPHVSLAESQYILGLLKKSKNVWAIATKDSDKMIGTFSFKPMTKHILEIGYALDSSYWNRGIITEVVHVMVRYLFEYRKVHELVCGHLTNNLASKRVIEKNNFKLTKVTDYLRYDGTYHEAWYYSLRREDL